MLLNRAVIAYQSHHLWNWNEHETWQNPGIRGSINRTIFGIETLRPGLFYHYLNHYQSHHLWNWNMRWSSSAPYIRIYQSHHLWNWNSLRQVSLIICLKLSIAPSLELKPGIHPEIEVTGNSYQSHHLWNWNMMGRLFCCSWVILSIAPSLELKPVLPRAIKWSFLSINRTIFGIETIIVDNKFFRHASINRTIFGIETLQSCGFSYSE